MRTKAEILVYLQTRNSLLNGSLCWEGELSERPMIFDVKDAGAPVMASPKIASLVSPAFVSDLLSSMKRSEEEKGVPCLLIASYFSPAVMDALNAASERILAADLCGNGLIKTERCFICISHFANQFPSRPAEAQAFKGASAQVGMALLEARSWKNQKSIMESLVARGGALSQSQLSKTLRAYETAEIVHRRKGEGITVLQPAHLLERLRQNWQPATPYGVTYRRFRADSGWDELRSAAVENQIRWCYSPAAALRRYASCGESGPREIWTAHPDFFRQFTEPSLSPALADLCVAQVFDPLAYFQLQQDADGESWSGPVPTWIVASRGDARQKEIAQQIYRRLVQFEYKQLTD